MPLADHLPPVEAKGPTCSIARVRDSLDADDAHTLDAWLADRAAVTSARIAAALRTFPGITDPPARHTIDRHRRQECRCDQ